LLSLPLHFYNYLPSKLQTTLLLLLALLPLLTQHLLQNMLPVFQAPVYLPVEPCNLLHTFLED
jgi:uncharacterized membrane protein